MYVVLIVSVLMALSFGLSVILVEQIKMIGEMGYSVAAFYAADTGIEQTLQNRDNPVDIGQTELADGLYYEVSVREGGEDGCDEEYFRCITSIGYYKGTKRAIEVSY